MINLFLTPQAGITGPMRFAMTLNTWLDEDQSTASSALPTGWHHVAVMIDAGNKIDSLCLDGRIVTTKTAARYPLHHQQHGQYQP